MNFLVPSSEAPCGGQGEKVVMDRNCVDLLLVFQTICRPQNSLGKILGMRLWEGREAVKRGWSGAGENMCMGLLVIRRFKL